MQKIAIIPAYEPPESFPEYCRQLFPAVDRLIVVDDGSGSAYSATFDAIRQIPGAAVLTIPENHGKGYALKYAFSHCAQAFAAEDLLVTADCDGQHAPSDVANVLAAAEKAPNDMVLGTRDFTDPNVPAKSLFGNKNMRFWLKLLYAIDVADSQTGLRAFTVKTAVAISKVSGNRFEYETGVLIYAKRNQIPIRQVPIRTIYPEDPADHVTHFRAGRDSARVIGTMFKYLIPFVLSSSAATVTDILVFALMANLVFPNSTPLQTLLATITARVISSVINFFLNCKHVFHGRPRQAIARYYTLWAFQLAASYGLVYLFGHVLGGQVTLMKILGDGLLSVIGYQIQCRWVYRQDLATFYGPFSRFCRWVARVFSRRYRCDFSIPDEPVVYVCRHLDMHGPYTTLKWLPHPVHPLVLSVFMDRQSSIRQFREYTFSKRYGKKVKKFHLGAWIVGAFTCGLVNSLKAVPVYRHSSQTISTMKQGLKYLLRGESLCVYADINYTDGYDRKGPIYTGFLFMGQLYRKQTGKSLKFVPLYIDDANRVICSREEVTVDNFRTDADAAAQLLTDAINRPEEILPAQTP